MERDVGKLIKVPGEMTSAAVNHIVAAAIDIYDYNQKEYQEIINSRLQSQIDDIDELASPDSISLDYIDLVCN